MYDYGCSCLTYIFDTHWQTDDANQYCIVNKNIGVSGRISYIVCAKSFVVVHKISISIDKIGFGLLNEDYRY